ncbi:hypothetical protein EB118_12890 [bacterium]|nr:hypothetical protein [bacterium]
MKKIKLYFISILSAMSLLAPFAVTTSTHALFEGSKDQACAGANLNDTGCSANQGEEQVNSTISTVINLLSFLVGVVSVIMIIIGGIRFVTSQGNAHNKARTQLTK